MEGIESTYIGQLRAEHMHKSENNVSEQVSKLTT